MPDTAPPSKLANLTDSQLLDLYLSLSPPSRETIFISTAEAAKFAGLSLRTIQLWLEAGVLRAIFVGRKYRIVRESLRVHLENQMNRQGKTRSTPRI